MDDYCYECAGYGDDYYYDEETHDLVCACYECPFIEKSAIKVANLKFKAGERNEL